MDYALHLEKLSYRWPRSSEDTLRISELYIKKEESIFLEGPSGSGKSTLLSIIGGVLDAQGFRLEVLDYNFLSLAPSKKDQIRAEKIGFIFQIFNLLPFLSTIENVLLPCRYSEKRRRKALQNSSTLDDEARRLLTEMGLETRLQDKDVSNLSVGQQQRVAVARALIGGPELIIADEPSSALDEAQRDNFIKLLKKETQKSHAALLFVSHDKRLASHFDRSISLPDINEAWKK